MPGKAARNVNPPWQYACRQGGLAISQDARRPNRVDVGEAFARPIFDHWLSVTLVGRKSNRAGIGAEVIARTAGLTQHRFCHTDGSYLSASDR